jgi:hypothetical protein
MYDTLFSKIKKSGELRAVSHHRIQSTQLAFILSIEDYVAKIIYNSAKRKS